MKIKTTALVIKEKCKLKNWGWCRWMAEGEGEREERKAVSDEPALFHGNLLNRPY